MDMIADILLVAGALGAGVYCIALSRRLTRFTSLKGGMSAAVAGLSAQVDEMTRTLDQTRRVAEGQASSLERLTRRAEEASRRLELLVACMHDLPMEQPAAPASKPEPEPTRSPPVRPASESMAEPSAEAAPEGRNVGSSLAGEIAAMASWSAPVSLGAEAWPSPDAFAFGPMGSVADPHGTPAPRAPTRPRAEAAPAAPSGLPGPVHARPEPPLGPPRLTGAM